MLYRLLVLAAMAAALSLNSAAAQDSSSADSSTTSDDRSYGEMVEDIGDYINDTDMSEQVGETAGSSASVGSAE